MNTFHLMNQGRARGAGPRGNGLGRGGTKLALGVAAAIAIASAAAGGLPAAAAPQSPARPAAAGVSSQPAGALPATANITGSFSFPAAVTANGNDIWVAGEGSEVTELNASTYQVEDNITAASPGYDLSGCEGITSDGTDVWVTNSIGAGANTVTEINAANGSLVRVIHSSTFDHPGGITTNGSHVWVTNEFNNEVTEFNATTNGTQTLNISTISFPGQQWNFNSPGAITLQGGDLWVTNDAGNSVTAFNAVTKAEVYYLSGTPDFDQPFAITSNGDDIWVANKAGNSVTVIKVNAGAATAAPGTATVVKHLTGSPYQFNGPTGLAAAGTDVWVENGGGNSATEINAGTWAVDGFVTGAGPGGSGAPYDFDNPEGIAIDGLNVWMANVSNNSVTVFPA